MRRAEEEEAAAAAEQRCCSLKKKETKKEEKKKKKRPESHFILFSHLCGGSRHTTPFSYRTFGPPSFLKLAPPPLSELQELLSLPIRYIQRRVSDFVTPTAVVVSSQ